MDFRNIENGNVIPTFDYADQPEVAVCDNGTWICTVTTAQGSEGKNNTFVGISKSYDKGKSWTPLVKIHDTPYETSYSTIIKTPYGRIYCFFDYNIDGISDSDIVTEKNGQRAKLFRYDMGLGIFCFKYSDDNGESWSKDVTEIPVRHFAVDNDNPLFFKSKQRYLFWNVSKPFFFGGSFYHALIKFQYKNEDFLYHSEGALLVSDNLETEREISKLHWETLPCGDKGLATPKNGGRVSEEHCYVPLSDGTLFCVCRTIDSHPCCTYSHDGGKTWEQPQYLSYSDGRPMRHVRAANFVWKMKNGKYLYWFHNNGGNSWENRNPAWVCAGVEYQTANGRRIRWSQPEIFFYDNDNKKGISYPDLFECDGKVYVTETQKSIARIHEIPEEFLCKMWDMAEGKKKRLSGLEITDEVTRLENPEKLENGGMSVILDADFSDTADKIYADITDSSPKLNGLIVGMSEGAVFAEYGDGVFCSRAVFQKQYLVGEKHRLAVTVDTMAGVIFAVCDGKFLDGADEQVFGWTRIPYCMKKTSIESIRLNKKFVKKAVLFDRPVSVSEICTDSNAGL